jgi:hypothetical protein
MAVQQHAAEQDVSQGTFSVVAGLSVFASLLFELCFV